MSGSFESEPWNAYVRRLDPVYTLIQKSFGGMETETMLTSMGKSPLPEAQSRFEPGTLHYAGQRAQHTTDRAVPAPLDTVFDHCFHKIHSFSASVLY